MNKYHIISYMCGCLRCVVVIGSINIQVQRSARGCIYLHKLGNRLLRGWFSFTKYSVNSERRR